MTVVNTDYDFVTFFNLIGEIENECHTKETIWKTLDQTLTSKQLRRIVVLGLKQHYKKTHDFSIIKNINDALNAERNKNETKQDDNENNKNEHKNNRSPRSVGTAPKSASRWNRNYYSNQVFKTRNLKCMILQYLNLKSLINCCKINVEWFYDSYDPASIYHVDINQLFKACGGIGISSNRVGFGFGRQYGRYNLYNNNNRSTSNDFRVSCYKTYFSNILRFKSAVSIVINLWQSDQPISHQLNKYLQCLSDKFLKIKNIEINITDVSCQKSRYYGNGVSNSNCWNIITKLIENNSHQMTKLYLKGKPNRNSSLSIPRPIIDVLKNAVFAQLRYLSLRSLNLDKLMVSKDKDGILIYKNLIQITITNSILSLAFWNDLLKYQCFFDKNFTNNINDKLRIMLESNWIELSQIDTMRGDIMPKLRSNIKNVSIRNVTLDKTETIGISKTQIKLTMIAKCNYTRSISHSNFTCMYCMNLCVLVLSNFLLFFIVVFFCQSSVFRCLDVL